MTTADTVSVLVVEHRHGTQVSVHPTRESALLALETYVVDWWDEDGPGLTGEDMPTDGPKAVERYFGFLPEESYEIHEAQVEAEPPPEGEPVSQTHSELGAIVATALDMIDDNGDFDDARDNDASYPVELHRQAIFAMRDLRDALSRNESTIDELIERSSFGTPEVKAIRARTPGHVRDEILGRILARHEIHELLELSARHLPRHVLPDTGMSLIADGVVSYALLDVGWLMWVPDDPSGYAENEEFPPCPDLLRIQKLARLLGCDYVKFDHEGPVDSSLPTWE